MTAMSESFVDLTYRGLALGRRVKLTQVRPTTGYVELPAPMPVGTAIAIATDDGAQAGARVVEVHEQVGGATQAPGMRIAPELGGGDAFAAWWKARVTLPELEAPAPAATPATAVTTVRPKRNSAVPELVDDGRNTAEMAAIEPALLDDGRRTIAMSVVDLEALGLDPAAVAIAASASGSAIPRADSNSEDGDADESAPNATRDSKPPGSVQRRKRKRR